MDKIQNSKFKYGLLFALLLFAGYTLRVTAYVASSTNYRIGVDSINIGGILSTSTNYKIEDTAGEIATGLSTSTSYKIKAGYQQMQETAISITSPDNVAMSPDLGGVTGGASSGSAVWTVTTDSPAGYFLTVKASTTPALKSGSNSFADYTLAGANPDYTWSVVSSDSEFGFSPEGNDIVQKYKDNGSLCNAGLNDTADKCWSFFSTTAETISSASSGNHPNGTAITIKMQAESGSSHLQPEGAYTATVTVTATAL